MGARKTSRWVQRDDGLWSLVLVVCARMCGPAIAPNVLTRNIVTARYIASKIKELLLLQLKQTMDLAALTEEAGLEVVKQWLALEIDDQAPTPSTYKPRKTAKRSVFVLDETHGEVPSPFDCKIVD